MIYICLMRKIVDIPDDILKKLKVLAALNDSNAKAYIESLVISHVRKTKIK